MPTSIQEIVASERRTTPWRGVPLQTVTCSVPAPATPIRCYERILVAVDGSEQSLRAVKLAGQLAAALAAEVALVYVADLNAAWIPGLHYNLVRKIESQGELLLQRARPLLNGVPKVTTLLKDGDPAHEIVAASREWAADLIVIGTQGIGRMRIFLLGSVVDYVLRHAPCHVLTVGHSPADQTPGTTLDCKAGCGGEQFVG